MNPRSNWSVQIAWLVLTAGLAMSLAFSLYLHHRAVFNAGLAFEAECRELQRFVELRLERHAGPLFGLRGMHAVEGSLSTAGAREYFDALDLPGRYPAIRSMDHESYNSGTRTSSVHLVYSPGMPAPPPRAAAGTWTALSAVEMEEMRTGGTLTAGASMARHAAYAGRAEPDLLELRLPLYGSEGATGANGVGVASDSHRGSNRDSHGRSYRGSVGLQLSLTAIMQEEAALRGLKQVHTRMHLVGREGRYRSLAAPAAENLLFDSGGPSVVAMQQASLLGWPAAPRLDSSALIRIGGVTLAMVFAGSVDTFVSPLQQSLPSLVLLAGLLISLLLFSLLRSLASSRQVLQAAVLARTRDLQAVNRALQDEVTQRKRLERQVFQLNVSERNLFGRELREGIGQELGQIVAMLESLSDRLAARGSAAHDQAGGIVRHVRTAMEQAAQLAAGLNPVAVVPGGFLDALERLAGETRTAFHVDCRLVHDGSPVPQDPVLLHNLYRITQQALTNAVTHGHASRIDVEVSCDRRAFRLAIYDDGVGWQDATASNDGIGLAIMRYRCAVLGLHFHTAVAPRLGGAAIIVEQIQESEYNLHRAL